MAKDLAWFPFFIEAWLGGTISMSQGEIGAYLLALIQQWKSGDLQAIRDTPRAILTICRGKMSPEVRSKFISITIDGEQYLRNIRLSEIYTEQTAKHKQRVERATVGAQAKHRQTISTAEADGEQELRSAPSIQKKEERSSLSTKRESKSHSPKATPDTRSQHPAIVAVRETMSAFPAKELWDGLIVEVGDAPDLERMKACRVEWLRRGYNKGSVNWLEWYRLGIPANGNGKVRKARTPRPGEIDEAAFE